MARIAALAAGRRIHVVYGSATPSPSGRPFNSAIVVGADGAEITRYHKMVPESWFAPGDHLALFEIAGVPCTLIVCHDERFPELVRLPVLAGARVCLYISYEINRLPEALRKADGYRAQLVARAVENGIWVVQSNGIGPLTGTQRVSLGSSRIVEPGGAVVQEAPALVDCMLVADIRPDAAQRGNALESLEISPLAEWWRAGLRLLPDTPPPPAQPAMPVSPIADRLRLALLQGVPVKWDLDANFQVFLGLLDAAAGADLLVTPECWLDGYAAPDPASTPDRLRAVAQDPASSPYLQRVAEEARKRSLSICFGFTSLEDGAVYNAAGLWARDGRLAGIYHKTHLQAHDLQFAAGAELPVWPTPWGPIGIMICADRRWPETARTLRLKGARLILNPSYGMHHEANEWWMRTRAFENQCFIAFVHPNVGFVADPKGGLAAKRDEAPGLLLCDIDLARAVDDNHLRDRRPELYQILTAPLRRQRAGQ